MLCIVAREYLGVAMSRMTFVTILATLTIGAVDHAQTPAPAATTPGIDCWMPRWDIGMNNPCWAPMRPALDTVERVVKANQAFMSQMPERVRMEIETNGADGTLGVYRLRLPAADWRSALLVRHRLQHRDAFPRHASVRTPSWPDHRECQRQGRLAGGLYQSIGSQARSNRGGLSRV